MEKVSFFPAAEIADEPVNQLAQSHEGQQIKGDKRTQHRQEFAEITEHRTVIHEIKKDVENTAHLQNRRPEYGKLSDK